MQKTSAVILRGFFFVILVTLISRSPCCSSSKSGSQARQECKSWYVTYISDFVTLKAVILSTWFTSSGYSFVSNAIPLIFEITLESLCNHDKNGPPIVTFLYAAFQDLVLTLSALWSLWSFGLSGLLVSLVFWSLWSLALMLFGDLVLCCAVNRVFKTWSLLYRSKCKPASIVDQHCYGPALLWTSIVMDQHCYGPASIVDQHH
ncbi:hypothetical protein BD560DRAFT_427351 [Blakeslea trispora]|nr:hypothetical protein BD560DRAFT_478187 [Blakeslea trispora]KAI8350873.1 hypothetical protein BD560DRAFT_427350 [Blakeslea trispora]KAI8350874.1 hypothetical protein BD560DRAFT_427351 [Blakeslea trispora]